MKAISIQQPFAALIATGQKRLEIRTWQTDYRGQLLICAGAKSHSLLDFYDFKSEILGLLNNSAKSRFHVKKELAFAFGKAICVVDLVGVRQFKKGNVMENDACIDWYPGAFAWELENPRMIESFDVKGKLRLFQVNDILIKFL